MSQDRFRALFEHSSDPHIIPLESSVNRIQDEVEAWCGVAGPGDDLSILALEIGNLA